MRLSSFERAEPKRMTKHRPKQEQLPKSDITQAHKELLARILEGDGRASRAQRRAAFDNSGLGKPLSTLIEKVAEHPRQVTNEDIAAARAFGLSEDQIFEIVVCGAIGQATRQYDTALAALEATEAE